MKFLKKRHLSVYVMPDHKLTYVDIHPEAIKPEKEWPYKIATVVVFAAIGVLLAWRG